MQERTESDSQDTSVFNTLTHNMKDRRTLRYLMQNVLLPHIERNPGYIAYIPMIHQHYSINQGLPFSEKYTEVVVRTELQNAGFIVQHYESFMKATRIRL